VIWFILGWFCGSIMMWRYMRTRITTKITMTAKDAVDFIESDDAIKKLKKEMHIS